MIKSYQMKERKQDRTARKEKREYVAQAFYNKIVGTMIWQ
jgi:hypothetical protein